MAVSLKMKAIIFVAFLSMLFASNSFAVTGGLGYFLGIFNSPPAVTTASLGPPITTPSTETNVTPGTWTLPQMGRGVMDLSLGRIEYSVAVSGSASYTTIFRVLVTDSVLGPTDCTFVFNVTVEDRAGGPQAVVEKATANGVDSSKFECPGCLHRRCEVFPSAGRGPSMYIYSRSGFGE
jgi:hypothetical protein